MFWIRRTFLLVCLAALLAVAGGAFGFVLAAVLAMILVIRRRKSRLARVEGNGLT